MKRLKVTVVALTLAVSGCTTSIKFSKWDPATPVQSTSLRFSLPTTAITLQPPTPASPSAAPPASKTNSCPAGVTNATWYECFDGVTVQATPAGSGMGSKTVWVASPDDSVNLWLTTTAISGTPIQGQDTLYSTITIKFTSNVSTIVSGAASGAAAGFGVGGPYGAAAGFLLSGIAAAVPQAPQAPPPLDFLNYLCPNQPVDLSDARTTLHKPTISFPIVIDSADAEPLAPESQLIDVDPPSKTPAGCWHAVPNATAIGVPRPVGTQAAQGMRGAVAGDGWLYRLVARDSDPTAAPAGAMTTDEFFNGKSRQEFPYSACRKVTMQVTWWKELEDAIAGANGGRPQPKVVTFDTVVADPKYVAIAYVRKGGAINFKADCGATVLMDADTSGGAILNSLVTAAQNIYKAEQTWASGQKK
jgi:hypothetical protein